MNTRLLFPKAAMSLVAIGLAVSVQSAHALPQWKINPEGSGLDGAQNVSSLPVGGVGFVQIIPDAIDPTTFQIVEYGAYQLLQPGTNAAFSEKDLTVSYSVMGSGSFLNPLALHFSSGAIELFSDTTYDFATNATHYGVDNGTLVGKFSVYDGNLASSGLVTVRATLDAGSLLPGYLFAGNGTDLAGATNTSMELGIFNEVANPDANLVSGIVCGLANFAGPGCDGSPIPFFNTPLAYTVRDGGYASITSSVPEPASLSMFLAGLCVLGLRSKRRNKLGTVKRLPFEC